MLRVSEKAARRLLGTRSGLAKGSGRGSKYHAVRTTLGGFTFASKREAQRYVELLRIGTLGWIRNLELQPRFPLAGVCTYVADFRYEEQYDTVGGTQGWRDVVEDVKGMRMPVYALKVKLFRAQYPQIDFREVR